MKPKKMSNDDPKGKKNKLFQSSGSPSKAQSRTQGPAVAAAVGLGTAAAGLLTKKSKPAEVKLEAKGSRQEARAGNKMSRANKIEDSRPAKAASLREKATILSAKGSANKKAAETIYNSKKKK